MISISDAYNKVLKMNKGMSIISAINYDSTYYVFALSKNQNNIKYDDPYYAVNKNTGSIVGFVPDDLEKYLDAMQNRSFDINRLSGKNTR